ncbi:MAG: glucose-6-phosphate dehydrogenase [Deltaproteobacteria bacterium]|nr:glucose-6-phosphate dehydrogenase [Deltaproteobacteria bacterium]
MRLSSPNPTTIIIFGGTGDLTRRKLLPALLELKALGMLPECFNIVGFATRPLTDETYREFATTALKEFSSTREKDEDVISALLSNTHFVSSAFDDQSGFNKLSEKLTEIDDTNGIATNKLYYLATPPSFFHTIVSMLAGANLTNKSFIPTKIESSLKSPPTQKIIIEKPFGKDLESAETLNKLLLKEFEEDDIFRIDHYLGKETVQNILFFRFANGIYEPVWNRKYIDHIQITVSENHGVGSRGKYFEEAGILRDMFQNHIIQLIALVGMEPPINMEAESIRSKKIDLLKSLRPITKDMVNTQTVRGQYLKGRDEDDEIKAYKEENNVSPTSKTETFTALKLFIDNWRWSGVPFYIRTGKRLKERLTEIAVFFKEVPHCLFTDFVGGCPNNNKLIIKIQPDERIIFCFNIKVPGAPDRLEEVQMDFSYSETYKTELPDAYERLLYDCMIGDSTLFPHREDIKASWSFVTEILEGWEELEGLEISTYDPLSWGPKEASDLIEKDSRKWRNT